MGNRRRRTATRKLNTQFKSAIRIKSSAFQISTQFLNHSNKSFPVLNHIQESRAKTKFSHRKTNPYGSKSLNPNTQENRKFRFTHQRGLEKMLDHENLIGGIDGTIIDPTPLDRNHTVNTGKQNNKNSSGDGLHHNRTATALQPIDGQDHKLPQRGFEGKEQYENHLRYNHCEQ